MGYAGPNCMTECLCDTVGSIDLSCNANGICSCNVGYDGDKCDQCATGYYLSNGICQGIYRVGQPKWYMLL